MKGLITEIKRFAVHDGPGIRTTVFFKGCSLGCLWCHNPECISPAPEVAHYPSVSGEKDNETLRTYGRFVEPEELFRLLAEDRLFYDTSDGGVTLSGGECLMQADFLTELIPLLKKEGISVAVDTAGFVPWENVKKVLDGTDLFLYDLKAIDPIVHKRCTGHTNEQILENLSRILGVGKPVEIRYPYVPGWNDGEAEAIARWIENHKGIRKVTVLPYHNLAGSKYEALGLPNTLPEVIPSKEELDRIQAMMDRALSRF